MLLYELLYTNRTYNVKKKIENFSIKNLTLKDITSKVDENNQS